MDLNLKSHRRGGKAAQARERRRKGGSQRQEKKTGDLRYLHRKDVGLIRRSILGRWDKNKKT